MYKEVIQFDSSTQQQLIDSDLHTSTAYCIYYSYQSVSVHADWLVISHAYNSYWLASFNLSMRPVTSSPFSKSKLLCQFCKTK